jgi:hypothetical protein
MGDQLDEASAPNGSIYHEGKMYMSKKYQGVKQLGVNIKKPSNYLIEMVPLLAALFATNLIPDYLQEWSPARRIGLGKKCSKLELAIIMLTWHLDATSTAVGMQADGVTGMEGNLTFARFTELMVDQGYAKTHSQAMLYLDYPILATIFAMWYFFDLKPWLKTVLLGYSGLKAYAGTRWLQIQPNKYHIYDYFKILGGEGRKTPAKVNLIAFVDWLDEHGGPDVWNKDGHFDFKGAFETFTGPGTFEDKLHNYMVPY